MGDDPYDFDIAIPSGGGAGGGKAKSYSSQWYARSSDGSVSASDEEDEDEDEDEESVDARKPTTKQQQQQQQPAQLSARRASVTTAAASSSSSALDKAKNFLSKYSTKAIDTKPNKTHASSRSSRRVELSFDESMDFSQDESSEDEESREEEKQRDPKPTQSKRSTSSGSTPPAKRVTLSDSEDYGVADLDEEAPRKTKSAASAAQSSTRAKKEESQSDDDDDTSLRRSATIKVTKPKTPGVAANRSVDSNYEDEEDDAVASFMEESDEGDPPPFSTVPSFKTSTAMSTATKIEPKPAISHVTGSQPSSNAYCNATASNGDYNNEEESIVSKSGYIESFEEDFPTNAKPSVTASAPKAAVSESGAYEEEDFDEESGVTPLATAASTAVPSRLPNTVQSTPLEDSSKMEPNFDYSMDFSDDNAGEGKLAEVKPTALAVLSIPEARTQPAREEASPSSSSTSHDSDQRDYSDFLDSSGSDRSEIESELPRLVAQHADLTEERHTSLHQVSDLSKLDYVGATNAAPPFVVAAPDPHARCDADADAYATNPEPIKLQVAVEEHAAAAAAKRLEPQAIAPSHLQMHSEPFQPPPLPVRTASATRARILIVREYEQPTREKTEMRDASTQFTGNHAAIQADLTPDGMHSLFAGPSPPTPGVPLPLPPTQRHLMSQQSAQNLERDESCQPADVYPHVAAPLPPPAPSLLSSPGYSMDVLRLPTATTTSIYKQQLQALQEQILVKKRETERLVQERIAFQYSTLRGTERVSLTIAPLLL